MPQTPQEKALNKIRNAATTAVKQRFSGVTERQRIAIEEAASALTEQQFGLLIWLAFNDAMRSRSRRNFTTINTPGGGKARVYTGGLK